MTDQEVLDVFTFTLRGLLDDESIVLTPTTTRDDVRGWDSFSYVSFIATVEQQLKVKFTVADIESFRTVGEIVAATRRLQGRG